jgi:hypothetical protein
MARKQQSEHGFHTPLHCRQGCLQHNRNLFPHQLTQHCQLPGHVQVRRALQRFLQAQEAACMPRQQDLLLPGASWRCCCLLVHTLLLLDQQGLLLLLPGEVAQVR